MNKKNNAALDALYAKLPKINCRRLCQSECSGILMTHGEAHRVKEAAGIPQHVPMPVADQQMRCAFLDTECGGCKVYDARPAVCRLYGLVETSAMRCPHGCEPEDGRWMSEKEQFDFLGEVEKIAGKGRLYVHNYPENLYELIEKEYGKDYADQMIAGLEKYKTFLPGKNK